MFKNMQIHLCVMMQIRWQCAWAFCVCICMFVSVWGLELLYLKCFLSWWWIILKITFKLELIVQNLPVMKIFHYLLFSYREIIIISKVIITQDCRRCNTMAKISSYRWLMQSHAKLSIFSFDLLTWKRFRITGFWWCSLPVHSTPKG